MKVFLRQEQVTGKKIVEKITELLATRRRKPDIIRDAEKRIADVVLKETRSVWEN
jgi:hypothetical protein